MAASGSVTTYQSSTTTTSTSWLSSSASVSKAKRSDEGRKIVHKKPDSLSIPNTFNQKVDSAFIWQEPQDSCASLMDIFFICAMFQVSPIQINLDDLDALIADLSPEEVEELSRADPDVSRYKEGLKDSNPFENIEIA